MYRARQDILAPSVEAGYNEGFGVVTNLLRDLVVGQRDLWIWLALLLGKIDAGAIWCEVFACVVCIEPGIASQWNRSFEAIVTVKSGLNSSWGSLTT